MFKIENVKGTLWAVVDWRASQAYLDREIVETGTQGPERRRAEFAMANLAPEQRKAILKHRQTSPDGVTVIGDGFYPVFDAMPTLDDLLRAHDERKAELKAKAAEEDAEASRRVKEEYAVNAINKKLWALKKAGDLEGLRAFDMPEYPYLRNVPQPKDVRRNAIQELEKVEAENAKTAWIAEHGSDHLKRACLEEGYNCQRLYITERAAIEAPDFEVDFDDWAKWLDRSCPSAKALDALGAARTLNLGKPEIVWLTADLKRHDDEYYYNDEIPFEPCEAVVIGQYLGRYDLVKIM